MNILLMRPEFGESHISPHLGLGYLSASLKNAGHKVKVLDGLREKIEYNPKDWDLVGLTAMSIYFPELCREVEKAKSYGLKTIIGGAHIICDPGQSLIDSGADGVKVGIGAGASCTTRVIAGVGIPQLTAILDCSEEANRNNRTIIADGGIRYSGDVAKSLAGGANAVMLGSMLAGMDESPGETILYEGRQFKAYRGMGSMGAMKEGSSDRYFQENEEPSKLVPEGIEGMVPYRGPVRNTIHQITGGLRASFGYCGAKNISQLRKKA